MVMVVVETMTMPVQSMFRFCKQMQPTLVVISFDGAVKYAYENVQTT